jgi:Family of unknown function (DUF5995)
MEQSVAALVARMEADLASLDDGRRYFHATYLRTTKAVGEEIERGGFADNAWLERWDVVFADLYLQALAAKSPPRPWHIALDTARHRVDLPPLRHVLLGMNAHINYDLPQALLAVITPEEFDDADLMARREADHKHVDEVLLARVGAEDAEMGERSFLDRLLGPANRAGTKRFLVEARRKVWHNTRILDQARRGGTYDETLAQLEELSAAKVAELTAPGQVLLRLARRGFGVTLSP